MLKALVPSLQNNKGRTAAIPKEPFRVVDSQDSGDGNRATSVLREDWHNGSGAMLAQNRESATERQREDQLVDLSRLRIQMGEERPCGEGASGNRDHALRETHRPAVRSDPRKPSALGHQRVRAGWGQYGTALTALLSLGIAEARHGECTTFPTWRRSALASPWP
eukprot:662132-Amphidinium_carterae.1